jgi:hypothetical protein
VSVWDTEERQALRATVRRFADTGVLPYLDEVERQFRDLASSSAWRRGIPAHARCAS